MSGVNNIDDNSVPMNKHSLDRQQDTSIGNPVHVKHLEKLTPLQQIIKQQSRHEKSGADLATMDKLAPKHAEATGVTSKPKNVIKPEYKKLKLIPEVRKKSSATSFSGRPHQNQNQPSSFNSRPSIKTNYTQAMTYKEIIKAELKIRKKAEFDAKKFAEVTEIQISHPLVEDTLSQMENSVAYHVLVDYKLNVQEQKQQKQTDKNNITRRAGFIHKKLPTRPKFRTIADTIFTHIKEQQKKNLINIRKKIKPLMDVRQLMVGNIEKFRKIQSLHTVNHEPTLAAQLIASAHKYYLEKHTATHNRSLEYIDEIIRQRLQKNSGENMVHNLTVAQQRRVKHALERKILTARLQRNYKIRQEIFAYKSKKVAFAKAWMFYKLKKKAKARKVFMANMLKDNQINHTTRGLTHNRIDKELKDLHFLVQDTPPNHPIDRLV